MQLALNSSLALAAPHLSYCTNIHPGESWSEVATQLERALPKIKARVSPDNRFGIGLRLSALAAGDLAKPENLAAFKGFLSTHDLYVYTINGFPYGQFHQTPVKESVYLPDWRDRQRVAYTCLLADLLQDLLPDDINYGSISTVPGAYKAAVNNDQDLQAIRRHLIGVVDYLVKLEQRAGKRIQIALEPEPCCLLETIQDSVDFFQKFLLHASSCKQLSQALGVTELKAEALIRRHLGICLDSCHGAVEFEQPKSVILALNRAGIDIAKMQLSSALRIPQVQAQDYRCLQEYADPVYLHQVVERSGRRLRRYQDLPEALKALQSNPTVAREWRIHFHVPIFRDQLHHFETTQDFLLDLLALYKQQPFTQHLEVETYSWSILPDAYRQANLYDDIVRELDWVLTALRR